MNIWLSDRFSKGSDGVIKIDKRIIPDKKTLEILEKARSKTF